MPILNTTLVFDSINSSAQVGDVVYYSTGGQSGGFDNASLLGTRMLGTIVSISPTSITVEYDDAVSLLPAPGSYISFAKDKKVNTSSLLGYYASVQFVNNSSTKAELFNIGSEVSESSK